MTASGLKVAELALVPDSGAMRLPFPVDGLGAREAVLAGAGLPGLPPLSRPTIGPVCGTPGMLLGTTTVFPGPGPPGIPTPLVGPGCPGVPTGELLVDGAAPAVPLGVVPGAPLAGPALVPPPTCASAVVANAAPNKAMAMMRRVIKHLLIVRCADSIVCASKSSAQAAVRGAKNEIVLVVEYDAVSTGDRSRA